MTWTYEVINDGNIDLEQIELSDNRIGPIGCPLTTLPAGGSMICEVTGTVEADDYENLGSVAALDPIGTEVFAEDPSHYLVTDECSNVVPSDDELWPPNHRLTTIDLMGSVCGGEATSFLITGVTQDEPVNGLGDGDTSPDAFIAADGSSVELRRERAGGGNGRVYEIAYDAVNNDGAGCSGFVTVGVPHDQSGSPAFDDGQDLRLDTTVASSDIAEAMIHQSTSRPEGAHSLRPTSSRSRSMGLSTSLDLHTATEARRKRPSARW